MEKFRAYGFERDSEGMPTKLTWRGDFHRVDSRRAREIADAEKLAEHEHIYGKSPAGERL